MIRLLMKGGGGVEGAGHVCKLGSMVGPALCLTHIQAAGT